jgi:hypothetical protein
MSKGKVDHPVWYDGRKFDNVTQASIELDVTVNTIYKSVANGFLKGKPISRTPLPVIPRFQKLVHIHIPGEPLIPYPVTSLISSNWTG